MAALSPVHCAVTMPPLSLSQHSAHSHSDGRTALFGTVQVRSAGRGEEWLQLSIFFLLHVPSDPRSHSSHCGAAVGVDETLE
jgi:hypothetical protein